MFEFLIKKLKAHPRKIVFTEGTDPRILEASARLLSGTFLTPVLVGNLDEIQAAAEEAGFNIRGAEIIDPEAFPDMEKMVSTLVELRKGKMSEEECRKLLKQANYFGTMLVKMGYADALLGGATYSTADTVRPALQIIKTKPGNKIVSSCFILVRPSATGDREVLAMGDCAINIKPTEDELVEIAIGTAECAKIFGIDPQVAFLSYSTKGSGKGEDVDKMREAAAYLVGEHDFKSFCSVHTQAKTTIRTIYQLEVEETGAEIRIRVCGNGFLYNMVRIIAGTLIEAGQGKYPPERVKEMLDGKERQKSGPTAPAKGLCLLGYEWDSAVEEK